MKRIIELTVLIAALAIFHLEVSQPFLENLIGHGWAGEVVGWVFGFSLGWSAGSLIPVRK